MSRSYEPTQPVTIEEPVCLRERQLVAICASILFGDLRRDPANAKYDDSTIAGDACELAGKIIHAADSCSD